MPKRCSTDYNMKEAHLNTNQRLSALHIKVAQLYDQIEVVEADIRTLKGLEVVPPKVTGGKKKGTPSKAKATTLIPTLKRPGRPKGAKNKPKIADPKVFDPAPLLPRLSTPEPAPEPEPEPTPESAPTLPRKAHKARGKAPARGKAATGVLEDSGEDSGLSPEDQAKVDKALKQTFEEKA